MSQKEKLHGSACVPFVTRIVDQIKRTSKKQFAAAVSSVVLAAASIVAFAVFPAIQNNASNVSVMSAGQFDYDVSKSSVSRFMAAGGSRVTADGISYKSQGAGNAERKTASKPIKLRLSEEEKTFTDLKETLTLTPKLNKADLPEKYKWESSDKSIAAVDENGKVTPKMNGTATITCTEENSGAKAECAVTVDTVEVSGLKLSKSSLTLSLNKSATIKTNVAPDDAANKKLKWTSSDKSVAKVDSKGKVTAVSPGKATITCATTDGTKIKKQCKVTVKDSIALEEISLNYLNIEFCGLGCTEQLELLEYSPSNATDKSLIWSSTDESVAVVDENGAVSPVDNGTCEIVAEAADGSGVKARCPVTVSGVVDYVVVTTYYEVTVPTNIDVNETASSVVEEAEKYVGWLPYVWGGTDLTRGVDCSGFVCAVYEKFGYNLWNIRTDLIYAGREVSLEEARAGDIIVYNGHVAIYDGNGGKIHAPTEGYMVTHDYGIGNYRSIRRVIE